MPTQSKLVTFFLPLLGSLMFELHMHEALERRIGQLFFWQFSIETFNIFNAFQCSSTSWGTLHFTRQPRQPRSCEVAPDLRQFRFTFRPYYPNTSDSSSSLFHVRCSSSPPIPNGLKLAISKICVSAYKYNKPSKIQLIDASQAAKSLAQKTVLLISKKGASCVSFGDKLKLRKLLRLVPWATDFEHHVAQNLGKAHLGKGMKVQVWVGIWVYFEQQKSVHICCCVETFMFNASSSKSNSSTSWGTLHFTRQPRSCEVAPDLRQFRFTFRPYDPIQVTVHHLYFTSDVL